MSPKEQFALLGEMFFTVGLIAFFIFYFIVGNRVASVAAFMQDIAPLSFFGLMFIIKMRVSRREYRKKVEESSSDIVLYLTYFHKFMTDLILFSMPVILLLIPLFLKGKADLADVFQASIAFIIFALWERKLFSNQ